MGNIVSWQNKDITSKVMAERMKEKSLKVYGLDVPKIVQVLPTNLPEISANEMRIDNLFLLEDGTLAIIDYESKYRDEDKVKYLQYVARVVERYRREGKLKMKIRMIVIYTADVEPREVTKEYDMGALQMEIQPAFLSEMDSREIMERLQAKVNAGEHLTDEEMMEFIILPLTYRGDRQKKQAIKEVLELARMIREDEVQRFVLSGILVFTDKVIDKEDREEIGRRLMMTQVEEYIWEQHKKIFDKQLAEVEEEHRKREEKLKVGNAKKAKIARELRAEIKKVRVEKEVAKAESEKARAEKENAIVAFVRDKIEDEVAKECIVEKLMRFYHLSERIALEYYEKGK